MQNKTQQRPKFSVTEGSQLKGIEIAVIPEEWEKKRSLIQEIENPATRKIKYLRYSIVAQKVKELMDLDPNNTQICKFRDAITNALQSYAGMLVNWLETNAINVAPKVATYTDLYNIENYLSFDSFVKTRP